MEGGENHYQVNLTCIDDAQRSPINYELRFATQQEADGLRRSVGGRNYKILQNYSASPFLGIVLSAEQRNVIGVCGTILRVTGQAVVANIEKYFVEGYRTKHPNQKIVSKCASCVSNWVDMRRAEQIQEERRTVREGKGKGKGKKRK